MLTPSTPCKVAGLVRRQIFVVDDHPIVRRGLAQLIDCEADLQVCGQGEDVDVSFRAIKTAAPDLILLDIMLGDGDGVTLLKRLRAFDADLPVLMLSMHDESLYALRAMRAGADGYVMKHEAMTNVVQAIHEVFNGRPYLSPAMAAQVIAKFAHRQAEGEVDAVERLSDRELEILELIGKGNEVRQIAKLLNLSPKTVETHRAHIKDKLDLKNSREVARFALQWLQARGA